MGSCAPGPASAPHCWVRLVTGSVGNRIRLQQRRVLLGGGGRAGRGRGDQGPRRGDLGQRQHRARASGPRPGRGAAPPRPGPRPRRRALGPSPGAPKGRRLPRGKLRAASGCDLMGPCRRLDVGDLRGFSARGPCSCGRTTRSAHARAPRRGDRQAAPGKHLPEGVGSRTRNKAVRKPLEEQWIGLHEITSADADGEDGSAGSPRGWGLDQPRVFSVVPIPSRQGGSSRAVQAFGLWPEICTVATYKGAEI
jgi:hypothetical protein